MLPENHNPESRSDWERQDDRWMHANRWRGWIILAVMIAAYLTWTGIIFLFEPGIR